MKSRIVLAMVILLAPAGLQASPIQIVDTGPGPANPAGFLLDPTQWLAVKFDVADTAVITDVQAWMQVVTGGNLDLSLYEGGSSVPGALLFRSTGFIESSVRRLRLHFGYWTLLPRLTISIVSALAASSSSRQRAVRFSGSGVVVEISASISPSMFCSALMATMVVSAIAR